MRLLPGEDEGLQTRLMERGEAQREYNERMDRKLQMTVL